ncbi:MAG: response regulator transcription factor [Deltaproteobacteria bacterium]|jgi:two-component system, OmpR family, alkaline phosphatase synthesis response regulator PhoP|nr:response regulator transcription factor [Deltaproteobacteria bacterium]MBT4527017.1 response regulator transcription factor [Deltaproteobacteria bacterium]
MKILIVEDDFHTRNGLIEILEAEGYQTFAAENGQQALSLFYEVQPDVVCLDIMMPEMNGYDVCRKIRIKNSEVSILFISAKSEEIDKVLGLELGADDFIVKPFGVKEVIARIRAVTRRNQERINSEALTDFQMADLRIFPKELRAKRGQETIELSLKDIKILTLLHKNQGNIVNRDQIFDFCWGMDYLPNSRTLDQHISQLRKKIEKDPKSPFIIKTIHGIGYRYEEK